MYLKEIITSGFKSFADKLDLKLDDEVTCIVGPNGSGKSNVVDAVRWVLGEQSIKSLRGDGSMTEVIFSGSKTRKPLNVASVELVFDNSDHFLNIPYTELSIKRRVYRSGENEYYLNGEKCRLKDLTNLLIDTGMSKESFNIISQGEVEKIISNSPSDRRIIFEEAAGNLKYKRRKAEALRKLDRTHNNIDRINDIINELQLQIGPLKEQSEKAKIYLENKKGLDNYEVALLAYDIENANIDLETATKEKEKIDKDIININTENSKNDAVDIEENNILEKKQILLRNLNKQLLDITGEVEKINGDINLLKEKSKTTKEENEIKEELRKILEEKASVEGKITILKEEINFVIENAKEEDENSKSKDNDITKLKSRLNMLNVDYRDHDKKIININYKIDSLKKEIEEGGDLPNSVRSILKATNLTGIDNIIGNILKIDDKYTKALNIATTSNKNFIITEDEVSAKKAINYLKDNHLGRATFFPLSVIKERYVDPNTINLIKSSEDFIGVLSDLVDYDKKYNNIVKNQLGTIIVSEDLNSATRLSHLIKSRYKIVTLDGDVINVGGSLSGGSTYKTKSVISLKQDLNHFIKNLDLLQKEQAEIDKEILEVNEEIKKLEEEQYDISKKKVTLKEKYDNKTESLKKYELKLEEINKEYESLDAIKHNSLDQKEQELIKLYHEKNTLKESISKKITNLNEEISILKDKIENRQASNKLQNATLRNLEKLSREKEVIINRLDVLLDNMLKTLSEDYELTFENAKNNYKLDIEPDEARKKVSNYKANIKQIGMVNVNSIEEYEKVNTRYIFLNNQKEDLLKAEDTLLEIMKEMDEVMKEEFKSTFENVQREFKSVFKELFNGGNADLKLTNPDDLLTTGVEIIASPPGKKLTTISLLSGGEKTLTAISLLFAILNVRAVPFCLFDEVEAALDEANVDQFGKYLNNYKDKTQFLIITHKKKTMEYAKTLYGITMQESGVSKLVSVKLEEHADVV